MKEVVYDMLYKREMTHWWDRVRRKIAVDLAKEYLKENKINSAKILDVGCGTGAFAKEFKNLGEYYGIDISPKAVDFCKKRGIKNVKEGSATDLNYSESEFDIVLALDVLEHLKNDQAAIREIRRVLKPGGIAIIFVPAFSFLWSSSDITSQHFRRYTLKDLKLKSKEEGFKIIRSSYFNTFLFPPILAVRMAVRYLHLPFGSEYQRGYFVNKILYSIFFTESIFLRFFNFPLGVSAMIICKK
jgi:SAM-dependent methyltransferase